VYSSRSICVRVGRCIREKGNQFRCKLLFFCVFLRNSYINMTSIMCKESWQFSYTRNESFEEQHYVISDSDVKFLEVLSTAIVRDSSIQMIHGLPVNHRCIAVYHTLAFR